MIDMWAAAIDRGDINGVILLDFRKSFDLKHHECLLKKHNIYQCDDNANMWFRSYRVCHMVQSLAHCCSYFTLMTVRFTSTMISTCLLMTLHTSGPNIEEIQPRLQPDLNTITTRCTDNNMVIKVMENVSYLNR